MDKTKWIIIAILIGIAFLLSPIIINRVCTPVAGLQENFLKSRQIKIDASGQANYSRDTFSVKNAIYAISSVDYSVLNTVNFGIKHRDKWISRKFISKFSFEEHMAFEACRMFWVTYGTMFMGLLGVLFIWRDISQSRDMGRAQVRAYLFAKSAEIRICDFPSIVSSDEFSRSGETERIPVWLTFKNNGQSPVKGFTVTIGAKVYSNGDDIPSNWRLKLDSGELESRTKYWSVLLVDDEPIPARPNDMWEKAREFWHDNTGCRLFVFGYVTYEDIFGENFESEFVFHASCSDRDMEKQIINMHFQSGHLEAYRKVESCNFRNRRHALLR